MFQEQSNSKEFLIGVVEGFYGRPWTTEQRKRIFMQLRKHGMNTFIYGPKDDCKHRAFWRELYTVEETEHLIGLVTAAKENNIDFFYSLSPGLDITYSSEKDMSALKKKLEQVTQFGCSAIALLFDDIEPEMSKKDKEVFQSFAQAQVSVTNEVFHHLKIKKFLFCPTQYCSSRAIPDVTNSEYLNTLGKKLDGSIGILWTGERVISKELSIESIQKISAVLKRKPIIWDNIFANDYDQKRIFLGPYSGRSPEIMSLLGGILANPNCEFTANFTGIATLAYWTQCSTDTNIKNTISDVKLETEIEDGLYSQDVPRFLSSHNSTQKIYHPRFALINAINESWLPEFHTPRIHVGSLLKPHPPITMVVPIPIPHINTCINMTLTSAKTTSTIAKSTPVVNSTQLHAFAEVCSSVSETISTHNQIVMNSLVSPTKVITTEASIKHIQTLEPNHLNDIPFLNNEADTLVGSADVEETDQNKINYEAMDEEQFSSVNNEKQTQINEDIQMYESSKVTSSDILLLCDLFYLPFEHGEKALHLLNEFQWIKSNAQVLISKEESGPDAVFEWKRRSNAFQVLCQKIVELTKKIAFCENREICYELYSYVWEVSSITSILYAYVLWLGLGKFPPNIQSFIQGNCTYFSKGWDEAFTSGNNEPWVFRGGLISDLQRLIPITTNDLFNYIQPEKPITNFYNIRLYKNNDEKDVYSVCHSCCLDGSDCSELFPSGLTENIPSDRLVGPFLTLTPEYSIVIECENTKKIIGYGCAGLDAKNFYRMQENIWIPEMCSKYPMSILNNESLSNAARDTINHFHNFKIDFPQKVLDSHPSIITCCILKDHLLKDLNLSKRLITVLLAVLRSSGSFGVFCCINTFDIFLYDFYTNLGFIELLREDSKIYLGRNF